MSFFHAFNDALKQLLPPSENETLSQQIIECMDLTLLDKSALPNQIDKLIAQAQQQPIAAVCVYPEHLSYFNHLAINLATVVNFPHGTDDKQVIYNDIERAIQQGASEVDYVFPYEQYIKGNQLKALAQAQEVLDFCQQKQLITKVIIETGSFSDLSLLFTASQQLAQMGWHFLKTSTGKISQGASLTAVTCLLAAISESKASCGIKVSGGVRTLEQAKQFIVLAETILVKKVHKDWFRIGTSNLLSEILS